MIQLDEKIDTGSGRHRLFPGITRSGAPSTAATPATRPATRYHSSGVGAAASTPCTPAFAAATPVSAAPPPSSRIRNSANERARQRVRAVRQQERASAQSRNSSATQLRPPWRATAAHNALVELDDVQEQHLERIFVLHCEATPRPGVSKAAALGDGEDALLLCNRGFYKVRLVCSILLAIAHCALRTSMCAQPKLWHSSRLPSPRPLAACAAAERTRPVCWRIWCDPN